MAATFLGAAALLHNDQSYIRVESSVTNVDAGDSFSVAVYAGAHVPVNAVNIAVRYPDEQIKITGIDTGESVITIWTQEPYVEGDQVILSGGTFRKGFIGEHLIATINAEALESGKATLRTDEVTFLAGDGSGSKVALSNTEDDSVTVFVSSADGTIGANVQVLIATDIDGDGKVGLADVNAFMRAWSNRDIVYDFNNDRRMNFTDFAIILADSFFK